MMGLTGPCCPLRSRLSNPPLPCPPWGLPPAPGRCPEILEFWGLLTNMILLFFFLGASCPLGCPASLAAGWRSPCFEDAFSSLPLLGSELSAAFAFVSALSAFCALFSTGLLLVWAGSLFPNASLTIFAASSSTELCAAFASTPFSCKKLNISLLCLFSSLASSCTFIFAMLSSISAVGGSFISVQLSDDCIR